MAKFLNFFPIGSISDDNVYLGLSADSVDGTVINTLDQNIVFRLEVDLCEHNLIVRALTSCLHYS